jgi:hypothetical protein
MVRRGPARADDDDRLVRVVRRSSGSVVTGRTRAPGR